jgi:hypothetical protein
LFIPLPDYVKISLAIDFFPNLHQGFWAGNRTEPASLATLLVNFNFSHQQKPVGIMEYWNGGILNTKEKEFVWPLNPLFHCSIIPVFQFFRLLLLL